MKNILVVSHCILNNASKVAQDEAGLAEEYYYRNELMKLVLDKGIQLIQLPCPEFIMYGAGRWGHVKDQFDNAFFRANCREMLTPVMMQLSEYASYPDRFNILGLVTVEGSPSCGYGLTCRGDWGGELEGRESVPQVRMADEPGVFMEVAGELCREYGLAISFLSIPEAVSAVTDL